MRYVVVARPETGKVDLYVLDVNYALDVTGDVHVVEPGQAPTPFASVDREVWSGLVRAWLGDGHEDDRSALADARGTRDRLLALVEHVVVKGQT